MLKRRLGLVLAAPLLLTPVSPAKAQTVEEVLAKYYEAIGGLDNWKEVEAMRLTGTLSVSMGVEAPFTLLRRRPNQFRIEFTFQGMTGVQSTDGETAWMLMPFTGQTTAQAMPEAAAKSFKEQADFDGLLVGWEEAGSQVELLGKEEVGGSEAYKLKLTTESGSVTYYFVDAESYLVTRIESTEPEQGEEVRSAESLGEYKAVGELLIPHLLEIESPSAPGATQVLTIEKVELNPELEEGVFSMPAGGTD
ncbi:MAG: outer membrane lipoprotein-sorting protein [Gemmatimonadota bacterium]